MRTTFNASYRNALSDLQRTAEQLAQRHSELSSGQRISAPSDDPSGAQAIVGDYAATANVDQYIRSADSVTSRLSVADTVLGDMVDKIMKAQAQVTAAQGSTITAVGRQALVGELTGLRDALYTDATTVYRGSYLFSGTKSSTAPYTQNALGVVSAYQGNTSTMSIDVSEQTSVAVTFDGSAVLKGSAVNDVFVTMQNLIAGVQADNKTAINAAALELQSHFDRVVAAQSQVGTRQVQIEDQKARLSTMKRATQARLEAEERIDYAESITELNKADVAYKAALGATGRIGQVSLLDYLK